MKLVAFTTVDDLEAASAGPAFSVEGFGKLLSADVTFAPFTIICGKNNSGKSYLAYLLWAFYNHQTELFHNQDVHLPAPPWFRDLVKTASEDKACLRVDRSRVSRHVNGWMARNKDKIAKRILNYDKAKIGSFRLHFIRDVFIQPTTYLPSGISESSELEFDSWAISFGIPGTGIPGTVYLFPANFRTIARSSAGVSPLTTST